LQGCRKEIEELPDWSVKHGRKGTVRKTQVKMGEVILKYLRFGKGRDQCNRMVKSKGLD